MLDHFIAKNATAHKVNSYYTLAIFYCTLCVRKHNILGPAFTSCTKGIGADSFYIHLFFTSRQYKQMYLTKKK